MFDKTKNIKSILKMLEVFGSKVQSKYPEEYDCIIEDYLDDLKLELQATLEGAANELANESSDL